MQKFTTVQCRSPEMCDLFLNWPITEKADIWVWGALFFFCIGASICTWVWGALVLALFSCVWCCARHSATLRTLACVFVCSQTLNCASTFG